MIMWTGGIRANRLLAQVKGLELDKKGRCQVNEFLQIKGRQFEFALGDNAACLDAKGIPVPPTAQIAEQQSRALAHNIVNHVYRL
ncbi:FAD-dependent oxidoreductase [Candidatus Uhrbacteria bacterium]|nr:FAD-dependent oxidoreductase [Candidatus Uhrbacteria bacterium]